MSALALPAVFWFFARDLIAPEFVMHLACASGQRLGPNVPPRAAWRRFAAF
jgi:hypothetical protein